MVKTVRLMRTEGGTFYYAKSGHQVKFDNLEVRNNRVYKDGRLYGTLPTKLTKDEKARLARAEKREEKARKQAPQEDPRMKWWKEHQPQLTAFRNQVLGGLDETIIAIGMQVSLVADWDALTPIQQYEVYHEFENEDWSRNFKIIYEEMASGIDPEVGTFADICKRFLEAVNRGVTPKL